MINSNEKQEFYKAHLARDKRFDGKFFVAVKTTGIYCRPICPARKAKLANLTFYTLAAQAEEAGYRPCLRCRPETAPGSPAWIGTSACVQRAVRLMDAITHKDITVQSIAEQLGISDRWLRQLFHQQVGASPQSVLLFKKLDIARNLLDHSSLSITDIAFSAGFQSVRRFNDAFKKRFHKTPSEVRQYESNHTGLQLILNYRPPYDWKQVLSYLQMRAIPGIESVFDNSYEKQFNHEGNIGFFSIHFNDNDQAVINIKLDRSENIMAIIAKIKHMFDLDADPLQITDDLSIDRKLRPILKQQPGIRITGCFDGFEMAVRAIIGQKISVKAARTVLIRLVERCAKNHFPTADDILSTDLSNLGLTNIKISALTALSTAVARQEICLDGTADYDKTCQQLLALKGIGPWTVELIAMRALKNPNAFPEKDLELIKKIKQYNLNPEIWAPWRAYAAMLLLNDNGDNNA